MPFDLIKFLDSNAVSALIAGVLGSAVTSWAGPSWSRARARKRVTIRANAPYNGAGRCMVENASSRTIANAELNLTLRVDRGDFLTFRVKGSERPLQYLFNSDRHGLDVWPVIDPASPLPFDDMAVAWSQMRPDGNPEKIDIYSRSSRSFAVVQVV